MTTLLNVSMDTVYAGRDFNISLWPINQQGHLTLKTSDGVIYDNDVTGPTVTFIGPYGVSSITSIWTIADGRATDDAPVLQPANYWDVGISGPEYVAVGTTNSYTAVVTVSGDGLPDPMDGTYNWSISGSTMTFADGIHTGETISVIASTNNAGINTLSLTFTPNEQGLDPKSTNKTVTVVKVDLEPVTITGGTPPDNSSGIEKMQCSEYTVKVEPASIADNKILWTDISGCVSFDGGNNHGREITVKGDITGDFNLEIDIEGALNPRPHIKGKVLEKKIVNVFVYIVRKDDGTAAATTEAEFDNLLAEANKFYKQVAIEFRKVSVTYIDNTDWLNVETTADNWAEYELLQAYVQHTGGIEIYCIDDLVGANGANWSPNTSSAGLTIDDNANGRTIAHELGHACGLNDIYETKNGVSLQDDLVKESWLPDDWSGGTDTGYYSSSLKQKDLVKRLIMYGVGSSIKADFPLGKIYGINSDAIASLVKVGLIDMNRTPEHW